MHTEQAAILTQAEITGDQEGRDVELGTGAEADQNSGQQQWAEFDGAAEIDKAADGRQGQAEGRHCWWPETVE
ncbi:hypothetical protein D9M71_216280 [compost metagenome]